ncbi:MAG: 30S ribosomal protein S9 [Ignavibacteria bacterium]|nr:30S ribosomal protein S9 [Ignavibacteria bacterium]MBL7992010.1 30S ribosomal protein S9 [Candidatus Kapabacteria bacterium]MBL8086276.1 30S ribosomal protein S9 [Candidatus Obscuribacter sp.]
MSATVVYSATGKRKNAIAKVRLKPGNGKVVINGKETLETYLASEFQRMDVLKPLSVTGTIGTFDVQIDALGGGKSGQAGAMRLGIARALVTYNEELRSTLRIAELLTRDPRMVERKKYGRKKARKRFQFSKR